MFKNHLNTAMFLFKGLMTHYFFVVINLALLMIYDFLVSNMVLEGAS